MNETINYSNGSVNLKISFPVAKGRGITLPYAWTYNSAGVNPLNMFGGSLPGWDNHGAQSGAEVDGWNTLSGIPYATVSVWSNSPPAGQGTGPLLNYESGMTFTDSSGTMHTLFTAAMGGLSSTGVPLTGSIASGMGDGQVVAKLDPSTVPNDLSIPSPMSGNFEVTDKNGTVFTFSGGMTPSNGPQSLLFPGIEDRNGNNITILFDGPGTPLWTDSAGRPGPAVSSSSVTINPGTPSNPNPPDQMVFNYVWESVPVNYTISTLPYTPSGYNCEPIPTTVSGTRTELESLTLPTNPPEIYQFQYNNAYGLLSKITYPDGGWVEYTWQLPAGSNDQQFNQMSSWGATVFISNGEGGGYYQPEPFGCTGLYQTPVLASRTVSFDGTTVAQTQTFSSPATTWTSSGGVISGWSTKSTTVTTTDNKLNLSAKTVYNYLPMLEGNQSFGSGSIAPQVPVESEIDYYDWGQSAITRKVQKWWCDQFNMVGEMTTIMSTSQVSGTVYQYGSGGCLFPTTGMNFVYLSEQDDYDYGSGQIPIPATANPSTPGEPSTRKPAKETIYTYSNPVAMPTAFPPFKIYTESTDPSPMMFPALVSSVTVKNGAGTILAQTNYTYDGVTPTTVLPTQHDSNYSQSMNIRGNLTQVVRCASNFGSSCTGPTTTYAYDTSGQPTSMTDANGNNTQFSFADSFTDDSSAPSTNAYLTKITYPPTGGPSLSESFSYSYWLGYLTRSTDENSQPTNYFYGTQASQCSTSDLLERPTEIDYADGGKTEHCYNDTAPSPTVTTWKLLNPSQWEESIATMDGMEHVVKTQLMSDPGGTDTVLTTYNGEGKVWTVSNPFRGSTPPANTTTTNYYDVFGRPIETFNQDGSYRQWCYDHLASSTGTTPAIANCSVLLATTPVLGGTWVDSTDENGNHWQHTSDVFGRLTDVAEPNGASQSPSMETQYSYDVLNDLLSVKQCGASCASPATNGPVARSFIYNSLARLVTATNPETGTIGYTYDGNGNVFSKTDARNVTTSYTYDSLNRLLGKTYSGDPSHTPFSCYQYDTSSASCSLPSPSGPYWKGRLSNAWTQSYSVTSCAQTAPTSGFLTMRSISCYDPMGRITQESQYTLATQAAGKSYTPVYAYDLAGDLISSTSGTAPPPASNLVSPPTPITFTSAFDGAGHLSTVTSNLASNTLSGHTYNYPSTLFSLPSGPTTPCATSSTAQYSPFGTLWNALFGNSLTLNRGYDVRMRANCEIDNGSVGNATGGSGTITITGTEQIN